MRPLLWIFLGTVACHAATNTAILPFEREQPEKPSPPLSAKLDELVFSKQKADGVERSKICSDEVFLRRVFLDIIGTLPTRQEAVNFLADKDPGKRAKLIDRLLERPEFSDYWGMKWGDILRIKSEFPVNLWPDAAQAYDHWVRNCLRENIPYSAFARQLLTAEGSNFHVPAVNFFRSAGSRDSEALASMAALVFMGERLSNWSPQKRADLAVFFSRVGFKNTKEWKEEIVFFNNSTDAKPLPVSARLPDGSRVKLGPDTDPREVFVQWLISSPQSPFAQNAANRVWFWLFGRGIIQEPDDSRPDNPPSNPPLLSWLARQFVEARYDTKQLLRIILNSDTYQLSSIPPAGQSRNDKEMASYPFRRLEAEVLIDAINQIAGSNEEYMSMIPEPYTFLPDKMRSISLPDGSITGTFLELFGRPPRDTGLLSERTAKITTSQRLNLLNSRHILAKINKSRPLADLVRQAKTPREAVPLLYLTILSRYPTQDEIAAVAAYLSPSPGGKSQKTLDVAWALMNTPEFLYRH